MASSIIVSITSNADVMTKLGRINAAVEQSWVGRRFRLVARGTTFTTELRAGTTTFLTMAYILAVNASILSDSGAACTVDDCVSPSPSCTFPPVDSRHAACVSCAWRNLIVVAAAIGSFIMGALANLPITCNPTGI
jgi:adenine/guanine/hypoxanthine permease